MEAPVDHYIGSLLVEHINGSTTQPCQYLLDA